jgi:hypothetical protein
MGRHIYLIGSLRNPAVPRIGQRLRMDGHHVFDAWFSAGERADDSWKEYEQQQGHSYIEALQGIAACHIFEFDLAHLQACDTGVLVLPAGKSGHLELGYLLGRGTPGYVLLDPSVDRWDVMYKFATGVCATVEQLSEQLRCGIQR